MSITRVNEKEEEHDVQARKVSWNLFAWIVIAQTGLYSTGFVWLFNAHAQTLETVRAAEAKAATAEAKVITLQESVIPIRVSISKIENDVDWIKRTLEVRVSR